MDIIGLKWSYIPVNYIGPNGSSSSSSNGEWP